MVMVVPSPGRAVPVAVMMAAPDVNRDGAGRGGRRAEQTQCENGCNQCFHDDPLVVGLKVWRDYQRQPRHMR